LGGVPLAVVRSGDTCAPHRFRPTRFSGAINWIRRCAESVEEGIGRLRQQASASRRFYFDASRMRREFPRLRQFPLRIEEVYLTPARELIICGVESHFPPDLKRSDEIPCRSAIEC
jgi:hypothetical protein